jgi:hypothetical protein
MIRIFAQVIGGMAIVALSFFTTLYILDRSLALKANSDVAVEMKDILCRVRLPRAIPPGSRPVVTIGEPNRADIVYVASIGDQVKLVIDDWGRGNASALIDPGVPLDILFDYTRNIITVSSAGGELLRQSGKMSGSYIVSNVTIGANKIGYPGIETTFPEVANAAQSGDARCLPRTRVSP